VPNSDLPDSFLPLKPNFFHILVTLAPGEQHGYAIMQEVLERTGGKVRLWPASLYGTLRQLLEAGLIEEFGPSHAFIGLLTAIPVLCMGIFALVGPSVAGWFGREARIRFLPWEEWRTTVSEKEARITWDHIARSPNCSIAKAQQLLGYQPRYRSLEAVRESLSWLISNGVVDAPAGI